MRGTKRRNEVVGACSTLSRTALLTKWQKVKLVPNAYNNIYNIVYIINVRFDNL